MTRCPHFATRYPWQGQRLCRECWRDALDAYGRRMEALRLAAELAVKRANDVRR